MQIKLKTSDSNVVVLLPAGVGKWLRIVREFNESGGRRLKVYIRSRRYGSYENGRVQFNDGMRLPENERFKELRQLAERMRGE